MPAPHFRYWLLTLPHHTFTPYLPPGVSWIKGQLERGQEPLASSQSAQRAQTGEGGYLHWQVCVSFPKQVTLHRVKQIFGDQVHAEGSRSTAAEAYVWKDNTSVGHRFELGSKALKRNAPKDWDAMLDSVKRGKFDEVPADVLFRCYGNIKKIYVDSLQPEEQLRQVFVYWGDTGTGKSRRAWQEAGMSAYPKDPNTKFWDGYSGQDAVVIDEFRGLISIAHILRWLDRYPTIVEIKGSSCVLKASRIWITSNLSPDEWYPTLDSETKKALRRRFEQVVHFTSLQ